MCAIGSLAYELKQSVVGGETQVIPHVRAGLASSELGREESVRSDEREEGFWKLSPLHSAITTSMVNSKEGRSSLDKRFLGSLLNTNGCMDG